MKATKFRPIFIEGSNIDDMWFKLLTELHLHGRSYYISEGSYAEQYRKTFDSVSGFIHYPHSRPLAPQIPEASTLPPPTTDEEIEQYFANYLMNSDLAPNEDYRYATWIVGGEYKMPIFCTGYHEEVGHVIDKDVWVYVPNQIDWIIHHFNTKGLGNAHAYLTVGYPESNFAYDIPYNNEMERRTSPCLRGLDFRVIDGQLLTHIIYRSWDLVGGWPTNIGGFALLNEYVAEALGIEPGPLSFSCKDLHAYDHSYDYLKARLNK